MLDPDARPSPWTRCLTLFAGLALLAGAAPLARAGDVVAVVNAANPVEGMSLKQLRLLYGAYKRTWSDGTPVRLLLPAAGDPAMSFLVERVFQKDSEEDVARYYLEALFQQKLAESPPRMTSAEALDRVRHERGAIALVDSAAIGDAGDLRVLRIGN